MSGAVFTRVVRNRLRAIPLGVDLSLPDPEGGLVVLDRIVIGDSTILQREQTVDYSTGLPQVTNTATQVVWSLSPTNYASFTVPYVQVKQEVKVLLVREADLLKNGPAPTPPFRTLTIFPVFNISLTAANQTQGGGPLTLSYALAYVDFGLPGLLLDDAQRAQITQIVGGVKIEPAVVDLGAMTKLLNRKVSAINAGIACDPAGTRVALRADFDIHSSPIAIDKTFFEAGPADLLAGKEWAMLMDANALAQEATKRVKDALEAKSNLRILSNPEGSWDAAETTLRVTAKIKLIGACPGIGDDIDMDVRLDLGARFSVSAADHLVSHYQLDSQTTDPGQVFGCALTGALLYPFAGAALFEDKKIGLLDYVGGIAFGPFFSFGQLVGVINAQKLEDDISKSLGDTCHKLNDSEYECTSVVNLVIQLVPMLNSRFVLDQTHGVPEGLVLSGPVANLGELFLGSIGDIGQRPFEWQILGSCTGNGKNNFRVGNEAKIVVAYTPPAKVITARILQNAETGYALAINDNELTITPSDPPAAAPCRIRLITNRGVRTITIPAAKPITDAERNALKTALLGAGLTCFYWEKQFTTLEKVLWGVDPSFHVIDEGAVRQWQILLKALDPSSRLTVRTPDGVTVATGRPSRGGTLHLSLMFADRGGPPELGLQLDRPGQNGASPVEMSVQQTLYNLRTSVPVSGDLRRVEFNGSLRRPQLGVRTDRESSRWDVSAPLAPQLLEAITSPGTDDAGSPETGGDGHDALKLKIKKALSALLHGDEHRHVIGTRPVRGFAEILCLGTEQSAVVYDISTPDQPQEICSLSSAGRYEDSAATQNLMARYDRARSVVDLFEVVGRHVVSRPEAPAGGTADR
jgi:hypothetical protein